MIIVNDRDQLHLREPEEMKSTFVEKTFMESLKKAFR
jgi:hypothetical protein